ATAIINGDDDQAVVMISDCPARTVTFSFTKVLDVECQILANGTEGLTIRIGKVLVESSLMGVFNAYNLTEAFLICHTLGFEDDAIARALQKAKGAPGRLERVTGSGEDQPTILVDYAHTPDALKNVSKTLADIKNSQQKLHVIFGCGGNRDKTKRPKMAAAVEPFADRVTVTSDNPRDEDPESIIDEVMEGFTSRDRVTRTADRKKAIEQSIVQSDRNTIILIAGKGHETYQEIKGKRHHFDDRQIARESLGGGKANPKSRGS
ncbi:MAG TPA: cyanophycin synthetase, partial [Fodinibius sp.]|nr:cyanophycin synthetase [Fodinibius sp.]